uniref:MIF4G domain-containing protein n=1 Tax=viral metagenome TaxID=1070528 RepID=A0A6C0HRC3_9ZZZZ
MYTLSFFKQFGSNEPFEINKLIINNLITITKKMNIPVKFTEDVPIVYHFNKISFVQNISTKILTDNEKNEIQIKSFLNKVTNENIEEMANNIFQIMCTESFSIIFDISCKNKFFSSTFSKLIIILCENLEFKKYLLSRFEKINTLFDDIQYVSDEYINNKKLDERESMSCFYTNLYIQGLIPRESIESFVSCLLVKVENYLNEEIKKQELEELLSIVYLILSMTLVNIDKNIIEKIGKSTNKTFKGITNKSIFKCMDIMELN